MTTDYQNFTTINTPKAERDRLNVGDIWSNAIKCLRCDTVIRSRNRHDYVVCPCKAVAVDGGSHYCKVVGNREDFEYMTELYADVEDVFRGHP